MVRDYLTRLFDHVFWADRLVLEQLRGWSGGEPDVDAVRLFSHLLAAERVWLMRLRGEDSAPQPIWPVLTVTEMERMSDANREGYTGYLESVDDAGLEREVEYRTSAGVPFRTAAVDILTQVVLHGSYHRGQVARAVRAAGVQPAGTDFILYVRAALGTGQA